MYQYAHFDNVECRISMFLKTTPKRSNPSRSRPVIPYDKLRCTSKFHNPPDSSDLSDLSDDSDTSDDGIAPGVGAKSSGGGVLTTGVFLGYIHLGQFGRHVRLWRAHFLPLSWRFPPIVRFEAIGFLESTWPLRTNCATHWSSSATRCPKWRVP